MSNKLLASCIAAAIGSLGTTSDAVAQDAAIEEVYVTGSRIKRADIDGIGKVDVVTADDFAEIGAVSIDQLLKFSPFTGGAQAGAESNYLSAKQGYGTASVNLRGLGQNRTLVLVNGRRFVAGGSGANSVVDLNAIPVNTIERIETLLDGSSAIYGADAVAGVVNIITKRSMDGMQADASFGMTERGDAESADASIAFGSEFERGGFIVSLNYTDRQEARSKDRNFSECFFEEEEGEKFCSGSSSTAGGRGTTETLGDVQFNQDPDGDGDSFVPYSFAAHAFDFQEFFNLTAPYERVNVSANGYLEIANGIRLFTENTYSDRSSNTEASPASFANLLFSATYPSNPTGEALTLRRRMVEEGFGARIWEQDVSLFRTVVGVEGETGGGWSWEVSANYGKSESDEVFTNAIDELNLFATINEADCANPGPTQCVDWFGINDPSPEALAFINATVPTVGENVQTSVLANVAGELFSMPAGPVGFAAGIEYRRDEGAYRRTYTRPTLSGGGGSTDPIDANLSSTEVFAEATLPLAERFDLNLAARYSDYSDFDSEFTYKIGGDWLLTDGLRLRSTFSTSVRTPNIRELYTSEEINFTTFVDPCDQWESKDDANLRANCAADVGAGFTQSELFIELDYPGSLTLEPEEAETFTVGAVLQPQSIEGLAVTLDYYQIDIDNSIRNVPPSAALEQCYFSENKSNPACNDLFRDPFSGEVVFMVVPLVNAATEKMRGIDLGVSYAFSTGGSDFSVDWDTAYLDQFDIDFVGARSTLEWAGTISNGEGGNGSYTQWRSNLRFGIDRDAWGASYQVSYIGDAESQFQRIGATAPGVGSVTYHSLEGSLRLGEALLLRAGVNNLFDKDPPYYTDPIDQNTDPFTYDLLGRRYFLKATYTF
ncbi:MAG TPA: TonB-dependent receptor [Vicinamibacterales bacterium]|nr:TonB-dependent receptor [Vicinamibacterales bacterium]